jgi:hypothetical protein
MDLDLTKPRALIHAYVKPRWKKKDAECLLGNGGGEAYLYDHVLKNVSVFLQESEIKRDAKAAPSNGVEPPAASRGGFCKDFCEDNPVLQESTWSVPKAWPAERENLSVPLFLKVL